MILGENLNSIAVAERIGSLSSLGGTDRNVCLLERAWLGWAVRTGPWPVQDSPGFRISACLDGTSVVEQITIER